MFVHYAFYLAVVTCADPGIIKALGVRQEVENSGPRRCVWWPLLTGHHVGGGVFLWLGFQVGTMDHPIYNCNATTALVYPYGLSQWTHHLHSRYPAHESPKSPFKSKILPNGDLKIWKSPYLCIESDNPELR